MQNTAYYQKNGSQSERTYNKLRYSVHLGRRALSHRALCVAGPVSVNIPVSCFITFRLINCALSSVAGAVKCASWLKESKNQDIVNWSPHREGSRNASESQCLSACHPVVVKRHSSFNSCREGIAIDSPGGMSDETVEPCLMSCCVLKDYRLIR